ncbi:MAG TPA: chromosomal replication initiator protein DnaA [Bacteroidota bacterium]|nr:chromosomal replication initiator protein DnaA [Bacteroidota bacterium]
MENELHTVETFHAEVDAAGIWASCLSAIQNQVPNQSFKTWFEPVKATKLENGELTVQVPSQFFYEWLEEHYYSLIKSTISRYLGESARLTYIVVPPDESGTPVEVQPTATIRIDNVPPVAPVRVESPFSPEENAASLPPSKTFLNPRYTFTNFIKGDSNQLARAAASAVSNNPGGTSFNPLVLYGGTGLGKTHLIQAIGNYAFEAGKARRVCYVSSEKFTIEFVDAIQSDKTREFSNYYRSMDLLIVDDIQFFSGKEKTQDSFFHTFNTLHQMGKQIVLSSDKPPKDLKGLDERLISRFQWGLTADIQPPDLETRTAILRKKCEDDSIEIPQEVLDFIATNVTSNIRELEGCYISLLAKASLENRDINLELAKDVLRLVVSDVRSPITVEEIQRLVAEFFDIPPDLLRAKTRKQEIVNARQVAMYLAKEMTNCSLKTIGLHFGGRDHSTVIHAYQSVEDQVKLDSKYRDTLQLVRKRIENSSH